ncbi:unknown [Ruminococcus sp. CAG:382]|nr:unknown [Ruminococcus sp. CAG:382]
MIANLTRGAKPLLSTYPVVRPQSKTYAVILLHLTVLNPPRRNSKKNVGSEVT